MNHSEEASLSGTVPMPSKCSGQHLFVWAAPDVSQPAPSRTAHNKRSVAVQVTVVVQSLGGPQACERLRRRPPPCLLTPPALPSISALAGMNRPGSERLGRPGAGRRGVCSHGCKLEGGHGLLWPQQSPCGASEAPGRQVDGRMNPKSILDGNGNKVSNRGRVPGPSDADAGRSNFCF